MKNKFFVRTWPPLVVMSVGIIVVGGFSIQAFFSSWIELPSCLLIILYFYWSAWLNWRWSKIPLLEVTSGEIHSHDGDLHQPGKIFTLRLYEILGVKWSHARAVCFSCRGGKTATIRLEGLSKKNKQKALQLLLSLPNQPLPTKETAQSPAGSIGCVSL